MFDERVFADALRRARVGRGLSQAEVAERLSVTPQSVSRWERGEAVPDIGHLSELSSLLGVSLDALVANRRPGIQGLIGVDAGGSKTDFVLVDTAGNLIDRVILEKANPNVVGMEETLRVARRGIELLRPEGIDVLGLFFGGAGMASGDHADVVATALKKALPGVRVFCGTDALNVIACAADPSFCLAAISGTGSVVFTSDRGRVERVGGTGYFFEGAGGGFDVGRDAISAVLKAQDGIGERTLLTDLVTEKLGGCAWENIQTLYREGVSYIASFAPLVSRAAAQGDIVALGILERNSEHMIRLIREGAKRLKGVKTVVFSGSMLTRDERFRDLVIKGLPDGLTAEVPDFPPVFGACLHCARLLGLTELPRRENFMKNEKRGICHA